MERNVDFDCTVHRDKFECPDALVSFTSHFNEYGLIIHDGGSSSIAIEFCPWCEQSFLSQNVIYGLKPLKHLGLVFHLTKKFRMSLKVLSGTKQL